MAMRKAFAGGLFLLCLFLVVGCKVESASMRSGSVHDDDVEEPLHRRARRYEPALRTSNELLDDLLARRHRQVWERFSPSLQAEISEPALEAMMKRVEAKLGRPKGYKRLQWAFSSGEERGVKFIVSTKIVHFEKGAMNFHFVFPATGPYDQLVGFHTKLRRDANAAN